MTEMSDHPPIHPQALASAIDHTALKPDVTREQIEELCQEARKYAFFSVCVNSLWVPLASQLLRDSQVKICTVVGFPLGASLSEVKAFETRKAIEHGAHEIDMVLSIGQLKSGEDEAVEKDIRAVVDAARKTPSKDSVLVKVILETALLNDDEKRRACRLSVEAGADFVKTSTGFSGGGATPEDVALMRGIVGNELGVKASGGVRSLEAARAMLDAGASRIGASYSVAIMEEALAAEREHKSGAERVENSR